MKKIQPCVVKRRWSNRVKNQIINYKQAGSACSSAKDVKLPNWGVDEIAYCANVHPGTKAEHIHHNIHCITDKLRQKLKLSNMHGGLWVCESALDEYQQHRARDALKATLKQCHVIATTFNGFPQGDFHQPVVKRQVYQPTWADSRRLHYSQGLAELLADVLPESNTRGTISTLPLGYRLGWNAAQQRQACHNLIAFVRYARQLEDRTGKHIRLCLEMEPGCVLETTAQLVDFFSADLYSAARKLGENFAALQRYLGLCFDICHQVVMQENMAKALADIHRAGIVIGKVQVSSALRVDLRTSSNAHSALRAFAEKKYMHQVTTRKADQSRIFCDDLSTALDDPKFPTEHPWTIHYHLPIQTRDVNSVGAPLPGFTGTQGSIEEFFSALAHADYSPHLEIETYTWHVLPYCQKPLTDERLIQGLFDEHRWLVACLQARGLLESI